MWEKQQHTNVESVHDNEIFIKAFSNTPDNRVQQAAFVFFSTETVFLYLLRNSRPDMIHDFPLVGVYVRGSHRYELDGNSWSLRNVAESCRAWHFTHTTPARQEIVLIHIRIFILTLMTLVPFGALKKRSNIGESVNFDLCNRSQVARNIAASRFT